mgnify:CR=1 FL=1
MVVRVAQQAQRSGAQRTVVAADDARIVQACAAHGVAALLTRSDHPSGSDRLAEACEQLGLADDDIVVNVQGDEPLMAPALIDADLIALVPRSSLGNALTPGLADALGLRSFAIPVKLPEILISALWHPRMHGDPVHRRLRDVVIDVCKRAYPQRRAPRRPRHAIGQSRNSAARAFSAALKSSSQPIDKRQLCQ